jgi:putative endonuclease
MQYFVYIVRCADGSLYTGYATDVARRVAEHNGEGTAAGAKYTSGRRPVTLAYSEACHTRSEALRREAAIKKMTKAEKELLIQQ